MEDATKQANDAAAADLVMQGLNGGGKATTTAATATPPKTPAGAATPAGEKPGGAAEQPGDGAGAAAGGKDAKAPADAPPGFVAKADVEKMIAEALAKHGQQQDGINLRERFIREKMSDLPIRIQELMPKTGDAAALATAEQEIRADMTAWFAAQLKKAGKADLLNVSGGVTTGVSVGDFIGSKGGPSNGGGNSPTDLVLQGLRGQGGR